MSVPDVTGNFQGSVNRVTIGASGDNGGTRTSTVVVGGAANIVYGSGAKPLGEKPVIAIDVPDGAPEDWPDHLLEPYKDVIGSPSAWAKKCVEEFGADLLCLKFDSIHPDKGDKGASYAVEVTKEVLSAVGVPLILWGCGNNDKDNEVMPKVSAAAKGENCLIGTVTEGNYKTLTAIALADGHNLITESPLDINIAKQVNILVTDMGFSPERIVTFQSTGALGYGIEYSYSIMERQRIAALSGDKMMATPVICDVGTESWRAKEAKNPDMPGFGNAADRGPMWEASTSVCLLQSGADILRMCHPKAIAIVKEFINELY